MKKEETHLDKIRKYLESKDEEKLVILDELLSFPKYSVNEYKTIIFFLIQNVNSIHTVLQGDQKEKYNLQAKLQNFTSFNDEYLCVNEVFNGLFQKKNQISKIKSQGTSVTLNETNNSWKKKDPVETAKGKYETIFKLYESKIPPNEINNLDLFNLLISIKFQHFSEEEHYIILTVCYRSYPYLSKSQKKKIIEIYIPLLEEISKKNPKIFSFVKKIIFPEIFEGSLNFPFIENKKLCQFLQSEITLYYLYYQRSTKEKEINEIEKMKIDCFLYLALSELNMKQEDLNIFYGCYLIFKKNKKISEIDFENLNLSSIKVIFEKESKIASHILEMISYFYTIPSSTIILTEKNINFTCGLVELYYYNKQFIHNDSKMYLLNLKNLETQIFNNYKENLSLNKEQEKITSYTIDTSLRQIFFDITKKIKFKINSFCKLSDISLSFYPFGSVTQFLSGKNADLDIYLHIKCKDNYLITKLLFEIESIIGQIDPKAITRVTTRLCLFTFEYKKTKIDLNYYGICSVYGSTLLREYSLYDARLSILGVTIKTIVKKYQINNTDSMKNYLNSFSWMLLLITFLQDIVDPPVLPKLLNTYNREDVDILVGGKKKENDKRKNLADVVDCSYYSHFYLANLEKVKEAKKGFQSLNNMSCSELLVKFIEFIGFYFNYNYVCVNSGFEGQNFMSKIKIEKLKYDYLFQQFYKKFKKKRENDKGFNILIREPFDHSYNPANEVFPEYIDKIQKQFREIYLNILENGVF